MELLAASANDAASYPAESLVFLPVNAHLVWTLLWTHTEASTMQAKQGEQISRVVLILDDDLAMGALLKDFLEREGLRVIVESSAERAVATVELEQVDVVILDKEMPGMSGLDFLSYFRHRCRETPVILVTAFGGSHVAEEAFRRGATRYLEKPFRVAELLGAVHTVIDTRTEGP